MGLGGSRRGLPQGAAELLATTWRATLNAATMLGQSKTAFQAEIDAACELDRLLALQPVLRAGAVLASSRSATTRCGTSSSTAASKASSTPSRRSTSRRSAATCRRAPALMGNTVVWKPASSAMLSAHYIMQLLEAAGLPPGVINFVAGDAGDDLERRALESAISPACTSPAAPPSSTRCGRRSAPRCPPTAPIRASSAKPAARISSSRIRRRIRQALAVAIVRGGFEYQGQKCSAASRVYVPKSIWPEVRDRAVAMMKEIKMGDVRDFRNFMGAVIDKRALRQDQRLHRRRARRTRRSSPAARRATPTGYFIEPTLVETADPGYRLLAEEIFGPVVTALRLRRCEVERDAGAGRPDVAVRADRRGVRARSQRAFGEAGSALRNAAGNFYINDKPTGAVVGQQPFGGARGSGTNDKAGSKLNLVRWVSARTVKETFNAPTTSSTRSCWNRSGLRTSDYGLQTDQTRSRRLQ